MVVLVGSVFREGEVVTRSCSMFGMFGVFRRLGFSFNRKKGGG